MDTTTSEQAVRREAVRRRLQGERRSDICHELQRSRRWFSKWWAAYRRNPGTDFADRSRVSYTSPQRLPPHLAQAVVTVRQVFEAATTPQTRDGLIGYRSIQGELARLPIHPLPSLATIQRLLAAAGLTQPRGVASEAAYYPWPVAWEVNALHATDILTRHVHGGEEIDTFHPLDHYRHAVHLPQHADKTTHPACQHLRRTWTHLGLPRVEQFDNDGAFCGGHTYPHVLGLVGRLCLWCGVEVFFTPFYDPQREYHLSQPVGGGVLVALPVSQPRPRPDRSPTLSALVSYPLSSPRAQRPNADANAPRTNRAVSDRSIAPLASPRPLAPHDRAYSSDAQRLDGGDDRAAQRTLAGWATLDWVLRPRHHRYRHTNVDLVAPTPGTGSVAHYAANQNSS